MKSSLLLLSALLAAPLTAQETPNIIFLIADDMGIGDVGVYNQNARAELGLPADNGDGTETVTVRLNVSAPKERGQPSGFGFVFKSRANQFTQTYPHRS